MYFFQSIVSNRRCKFMLDDLISVLANLGLDSKRPTATLVDSIRESVLEKAGADLRAQRSISPDRHRSSSMPPKTLRATFPATPSELP